MSCKNIFAKPLLSGIALGLLAFAPLAANADGMMTKGADSAGMMSATSMPAPMAVSGTVLRYYTDAAGYVTAMDVQTADGVKFARFSPSMGQRLYTTYPVGGAASVYVMSGSGMMAPEVVSVGDMMPTPGQMMLAPTPSAIDTLNSAPYIVSGSKLMKFSGTLQRIVTNETGEVVGLVVKGYNDKGMALVRVAPEFRQIAPGSAGTSRITPLFKGADVKVTGYEEAPRYGVLSMFNNRIAARAIVVNGRSVGALGLQSLAVSSKGMKTMDGKMSPEEMSAYKSGYSTYMMTPADSNSMMSGSTMTSTTTTSTTTTTTNN